MSKVRDAKRREMQNIRIIAGNSTIDELFKTT